ncbi:MAG: TonB-dependent receptor [Opitutaceae bacterium]|nr:TonB-dependent receptor [Opitutaceae bacterium]
MKRLQFFLLLISSLLAPLALQAQTGTVSGRVTDDATKLPLGGVRVSVAQTETETYTTRDGRFVLLNVPAGEQTLAFHYVGYPSAARPVAVDEGRTTDGSLVFGADVVEMDRFVIEGAIVGTARAINEQRAAATLANIVAADEIGRFPDQNAAESLQRVPGVSLYRDQGEGRFAIVRGMNYTLGNVTLDGAKVASPEVGERGIALDVVPVDTLAAIEVAKVPTPDKDGEGLGGTVNIRTKSPFDQDGLHASFNAQAQYSALADAFGSKFNGAFSTILADGKMGFLVAPTWQVRKFGSHNYEIDDGWTDEFDGDDTPVYFLQDIAFRDYEIERKRYGASSAFEFKPDAATTFYARGTYNRFTDTENRHVTLIPFAQGNSLDAIGDGTATVSGVRRFDRRLRMREKDQELTAFMVGGEKHVGNWTLDGNLAWSRGEEIKPQETQVVFRRGTRDGVFRYDFNGTYDITVDQLGGASITDPASYNQFDELTVAMELGEETERGITLNARYDFSGNRQGFVKFGGVAREKEKLSEAEVTEYDVPATFTFASIAGEISDYPYGPRVPQISPAALRAAFFGNLAAFDGESEPEDSNFDDWVSTEEVTAAYAMSGVTLGKTSLIVGTRVERTEYTTTGKELEFDASGDFVGTSAVKSSRSYTNWLPGVYLRHDAAKELVVRASWSNSIVRPSFGDSAYRRNINHEDEEVTVGNPHLAALEAENLDASIEYYLPSLGLFSVAAFQKDIRNFSYETEIEADPAFPGYEITSFRNGSSGVIRGLELAYQQQLQMLPTPFDGLGVLANITFADSKADYPTRAGEHLAFVGQSDRVGNVALTYEKNGFFVRVALNFRSERLREDEPLGGDAIEDFWIDDFKQLDLTTSYRITKSLEVFAELLNLTNEPFRVYQKGGNLSPAKRLVQFEEYDWSANFGVRWKL